MVELLAKLMERVRAPGVWRRAGLASVLLGATGLFGWVLNGHYPLEHWLFWRYAIYWVCALTVAASWLSLGHLLVRGCLGRSLPLYEHLAVSFALGMFGFELLMFVAGLLHLYGTLLFFSLPLIAIAVGFVPLVKWLRRVRRHVALARRRARPLPWWLLAVVAFGAVGLLMIYLPTLVADNVQFDSRWKHLAFAEQLVVGGGIRRFPNGMTFATRPHFTSFLYAWAFMLPHAKLFDHMVLSAHLEVIVFLWTTMFGIPAIVRRLVPRADVRVVWAARLLFPGVMLYDASLSTGADHFGAMYTVPMFLLLLRFLRRLELRPAVLLGAAAAGGLLVKYTVPIMMVPGAALAIVYRAVQLGWRHRQGRLPTALRRNWYLGPACVVAAGLLCSAPHWLRNLIWYGDPVYPLGYKYFPSRPWTSDASYMFEWGYQNYQFWRPKRDLSGVLETLEALLTYSFVPHDWRKFHGVVPVVGSLFTLCLACLPFLKKTKRIWLLALWVHGGLFAWYWVHHQDRYLQDLMPWMAAFTAAVIIKTWRSGRYGVRTALIGLLGLQVVWGGDVYFIDTHPFTRSPIKRVADLFAGGFRRRYQQRFKVQARWQDLGKHVGRGGRLLLHENHNHLGIGVDSVSDWASYQFGLSYGLLDSPRQVWEALRGYGVTDVYWSGASRSWDSLAGDIMFYDFALRHTEHRTKVQAGWVARMPQRPPPDTMGRQVAMLGCGRPYHSGLYQLEDLRVPTFGPAAKRAPAPRTAARDVEHAVELAIGADFVVLDSACARRFSMRWKSHFKRATSRRRVPFLRTRRSEIWLGK